MHFSTLLAICDNFQQKVYRLLVVFSRAKQNLAPTLGIKKAPYQAQAPEPFDFGAGKISKKTENKEPWLKEGWKLNHVFPQKIMLFKKKTKSSYSGARAWLKLWSQELAPVSGSRACLTRLAPAPRLWFSARILAIMAISSGFRWFHAVF